MRKHLNILIICTLFSVFKGLLKSCMVLLVLCGNGKSNMVFYGMYDLVWFCLVMCGLVWPYAAMHNFCAC